MMVQFANWGAGSFSSEAIALKLLTIIVIIIIINN